MIFIIIVSFFLYAAYNNQTTQINYILIFCLIIGVLSIIYTVIISFFVELEAEIDKGICFKNDNKKIFFTTNSFLHPTIIVKTVLYNRQYKRKLDTYYIKVKNDISEYDLVAEECGDNDVIIKSYVIKGFFGIFAIRKKFRRTFSFKTYPKPSKFNENDIKELVLSGDGEPINKKGGDYQELYEIRPIQPGDNLRFVHPALSAKFDEYMIKVGSETQRKLLLYELKDNKHFDDAILELKRISAIFNEVCKDNSNYYCVKYKNNWYIILNKRSLYGLFDLIYKEYL